MFQAFDELPKMEILDLSNQNLQEIPVRTINNCPNMTQIDFRYLDFDFDF